MILRTLMAATAALSVAACETVKPLSELKASYPSVDAAIIDSQDEIYISLGSAEAAAPAYYYVPAGTSPAAAAAGGLFAALIIAGINSAESADARKDAAPMQEALADFDYGSMLRDEIAAILPNIGWTEVGDITVLEAPDSKALAAAVENSEASGLFVVGANFFLSRNADTAIVAAQALLHPVPAREEGAKPLRNAPPAVFTTYVSYEMPSPVIGDRRADHIPAWIENDGEALRAAVTRGAPIVARMLAMQLEEGNLAIVAPEGQKPDRRLFKAYGVPMKLKAQVLESGPDGEMLRFDGGALRFLAPAYVPAPGSDSVSPEPAPGAAEDPSALPYDLPAEEQQSDGEPVAEVL